MKKKILNKSAYSLIILEVVLIAILLLMVPQNVFADIQENNVTVQTDLIVGAVYPEIINVSIENGAASFSLTPASTTTLYCVAVAVDYNGQGDFDTAQAEFFDSTVSSYGGGDDNNEHYTNTSCAIDTGWDGFNAPYDALINCSFEVEYYANPQTWDCTVSINDTTGLSTTGSDTITIDSLLALGLPDTINYGTVNATYVSDENITNVTNYGNVEVNLSLSGYGFLENDGNAMNCTLGANKNISIDYEKYNLTTSNVGYIGLSTFETLHTNLTYTPKVKQFNLNYRQEDAFNDAWNETYWRIYVPLGVAGTCQGNIIFGAVQAPEV